MGWWFIGYGDVRNAVRFGICVFDNHALKGRSAGLNCYNGFDKLRSSVSPEPTMAATLGMSDQDRRSCTVQQAGSSGLYDCLLHAIVFEERDHAGVVSIKYRVTNPA